MARCMLTGKKPNVANNVSHANNRTRKRQFPNVQRKRVFLEDENRWVTLTLSTRAIRSVTRIGLKAYAAKMGVDLGSLLGRD